MFRKWFLDQFNVSMELSCNNLLEFNLFTINLYHYIITETLYELLGE